MLDKGRQGNFQFESPLKPTVETEVSMRIYEDAGKNTR